MRHSAGRSTSYVYNGKGEGELTICMDRESKPWGCRYDNPVNPHRMTRLTDPLGTTTAANAYDSMGRVSMQTVPRKTSQAVSTP